MSIIPTIRRKLISTYHNQLSKTLHIADNSYFVSCNVPHYSERCGYEKFGAQNEKEYDYWWQEACGIVLYRFA